MVKHQIFLDTDVIINWISKEVDKNTGFKLWRCCWQINCRMLMKSWKMKNFMNFNLEKIPSKELVYIDSNIFIYYVTGHPIFSEQCKAFLKRIEEKELYGATSLITFVEVRHKLV
jgi:hypothetical protein